ncbi:esterase/lipase family protein [Bifidobacterium moukalabense]|uniref:esterase/lipase family protein n=1 Tax=Bifidobacterium moukalabense TaxID=1333651 RepID=UPI0010F95E1C|nr:triacylglycerol lipase [Bifidobacterium moukalabense]
MQRNTTTETLWLAIDIVVAAAVANSVFPLASAHLDGAVLAVDIAGAIAAAAAVIAIPGNPMHPKTLRARNLKTCYRGTAALKAFWWSAAFSVVAQAALAFRLIPSDWGLWLGGAIACFLVESLLFWRGMIAVYVSSVQLGLRIRTIGLICGWIPVVNLVALVKIIRTTDAEVTFEEAKERLDADRKADRICATKYPILLVHGVFFRDSNVLNYWGRIPDELQRNGATIHYGNHQSAASVRDSAHELTERIRRIVEETGCGKVHVIAHSKGGIDMRYAIACCGAAPFVASLTTINTPHRGCGFADYLLSNIPEAVQHQVEAAYNAAAVRLGDTQPDFMAAVRDLTQASCARLNAEMQSDSAIPPQRFDAQVTRRPMAEPLNNGRFAGIVCRSVGSRLKRATTGKFPLNFTYPLVKWFDGPNDGLVAQPSFPWGESFTWIEPQGNRGISHADMIDLNRENIPGFDVREFYVQLVAELKQRGL